MALALGTDNLPEQPDTQADLTERSLDTTPANTGQEEIPVTTVQVQGDLIISAPVIAWPSRDLSTILSEVKVVRGITIIQENGQTVDSADLVQFKQDENLDNLSWAKRKLRTLSEGTTHAGVFNNLGCAYMLLREWIDAEKAFYDAAGAPEFADAHEAAEQNRYLLRYARRASD